MLTIRTNAQQVRASAASYAKQLRFAQAVALTRTAQAAQRDIEHEIGRVFDRPTPFTRRGLYVRPATRDNLQASVGIKDYAPKGTAPATYLAAQISGGARREKRFERALAAAGVMPRGWVAVPRKGARLNAYGNMSSGQITQLLSVLRASSDVTQHVTSRSRQRNRKPRDYFVSGPVQAARAPNGGRLPFGIYERRGRRIVTVLLFSPTARYRPRLAFDAVGRRTIAREMGIQLDRALAKARSTAR